MLNQLYFNKASLVAQTVKNLHAMQGTWVQFLGQEDPLEREWQPPLQYSCLENSMDRGAAMDRGGLHNPRGHKESDKTGELSLSSSKD